MNPSATKTSSIADDIDTPARARTRTALLDAALQVFAEKGVGASALHEIAARAGVSNGSFYNYFRTRDELVNAASGLLARRFTDDISLAYASVGNPVERLAIGCRAFLLRTHRDPTWGAAVLRVWGATKIVSDAATAKMAADLRAGKRAGRFHYRTERAAVDLVQGAVLAGMRSLLDGRAGPTHAKAVTVHILRGLGVTERAATAIVQKQLPALPPIQRSATATPVRRIR